MKKTKIIIKTLTFLTIINFIFFNCESKFIETDNKVIKITPINSGDFTISKKIEIHLPTQPSKQIKEKATILANKLQELLRVSKIEILEDNVKTGIWLGLNGDFESHYTFSKEEDFHIQTFNEGIELISNNETGVEFMIWTLLHEMGYRQYFPGKTWEVLPIIKNTKLSLNKTYSPYFQNRVVWRNWGNLADEDNYKDWVNKSRMHQRDKIWSAHLY